MSLYSCSWEKELELALGRGQWPQACDPNLREHVSGCCECQDLVLVTQALHEARVQSERVAPIGSPGALWWRAQLRRRNEAIERVTKPVALAEKVGLFSILAALCVAVWRWGNVARWVDFFQSSSDSSLFQLTGLWAAFSSANAWVIALLIAGVGTLAFFAGFAVYLLREEA
jgi:hypothetical protein